MILLSGQGIQACVFALQRLKTHTYPQAIAGRKYPHFHSMHSDTSSHAQVLIDLFMLVIFLYGVMLCCVLRRNVMGS